MCAAAVGPPQMDEEHDTVMRLRLANLRLSNLPGATPADGSEPAVVSAWRGRLEDHRLERRGTSRSHSATRTLGKQALRWQAVG